jgi:hypothetical protein
MTDIAIQTQLINEVPHACLCRFYLP